jgi:hypothetical protein
LNDNPDKPVWKYTKSGIFSVKSLYAKLSAVGVDRSFKQLWKAKLPLKIKIWLWLIWHNTVAIRDNMKKRGWWETTLVNSVKLKNQLNIFSLIALLLCTCGVQSVAFWVLLLDLSVLLSIFGGLQNSCQLAPTYI